MHTLEPGVEVPDPLAPYLSVDRSKPRHECWVTGHMVAGLDGTAAVDGRVGPLSTRPDQALYRALREIADIVMVGAETVRRERFGPVRLSEQAQARRLRLGKPALPPVAVVSRSLDLDWTARVFTDVPEDARTHVITCAAADPARLAEAEQVATVVVAGEERVEPAAALRALADLGHRVVLCEGGPRTNAGLIAHDLVDEMCVTIAPALVGGPATRIVHGPRPAAPRGLDLDRVVIDDEGFLFLRYIRTQDVSGASEPSAS